MQIEYPDFKQLILLKCGFGIDVIIRKTDLPYFAFF